MLTMLVAQRGWVTERYWWSPDGASDWPETVALEAPPPPGALVPRVDGASSSGGRELCSRYRIDHHERSSAERGRPTLASDRRRARPDGEGPRARRCASTARATLVSEPEAGDES